MRGIGRLLIIILVVLVVIAGAGYFILPSKASSTQSFTVSRPAATVFAYLASTPPGSEISPGVTVSEVTSAQNNIVTASVAYAEGEVGTATYTVTPEGEGSRVELKLERPLGANPLDRIQGLTGGEVQPLVESASTSVAESLNALPEASFSGLAYEIVTIDARPFFYNQNCSPQDPAAIKEVVAQSLIALRPIMRRHNLAEAGPPIAVETEWNEQTNQYCFQVGLPYTGTAPRVLAVGTAGQTPAGQAVRVHYTGTEDQVIPLYDQMESLIAAGRLVRGRSFEVYYDDATQAAGSVNRDIYYLVTGDTARLLAIAPSSGAVPPPQLNLTATTAATEAAGDNPAGTTPPQTETTTTTPQTTTP
ncbi:MAG: hypothetical protein AB7O04_05350 [Hyphomonadaceae bacterium]